MKKKELKEKIGILGDKLTHICCANALFIEELRELNSIIESLNFEIRAEKSENYTMAARIRVLEVALESNKNANSVIYDKKNRGLCDCFTKEKTMA